MVELHRTGNIEWKNAEGVNATDSAFLNEHTAELACASDMIKGAARVAGIEIPPLLPSVHKEYIPRLQYILTELADSERTCIIK